MNARAETTTTPDAAGVNAHERPAWPDGLAQIAPELDRVRDAIAGAVTIAHMLRMDSLIAESRAINMLDEVERLKVGVPFTPAALSGLQAALDTVLHVAELHTDHLAGLALESAQAATRATHGKGRP